MTWHHEKEEFKNHVLDWASRLGVSVKSLHVRPMQKKWASCSTSGNLHFNSDLLALDRQIADYVIVHELLHFSVPNHGQLWKSLMRAHLGDYEQAEQHLRLVAKKGMGCRH
jgi:predicted metal-dependent hydrolase